MIDILRKYFPGIEQMEDVKNHSGKLKELKIPEDYYPHFNLIIAYLIKMGNSHKKWQDKGRADHISNDTIEILEFFSEIDEKLNNGESIHEISFTVDIHSKKLKIKSSYWSEYLIKDILLKQIKDETNDFYSIEDSRFSAENTPTVKGGRPSIPRYTKVFANGLKSFVEDHLTFETKTEQARVIMTILEIANITEKTATPLKALNRLLN